jgi:hypothetical protein
MKFTIFLVVSILLFVLGYNFVFNTKRTISKYVSLSKYNEGSVIYKILKSESNIVWVKVSGVLVIAFALILIISLIIPLINNNGK